MEKLSEKMSDERLRLKLLAAGYDEEVVLGWDRENLLSSYAEVLASGKKLRPDRECMILR